MAKAKPKALSWLKNTDILVAVAVIAMVVMLIIPIPAAFLDFLLALNIAASLIILLTVIYVKRSIDFSVFPTVILFATIFRIALNVSSTRLILSEGRNFGGKLIKAFGEFVVGGNFVIGLIIFLIIIAVQIIVVTKGATRVSEVAARFTLDALPGKQMEITNELSAGLIAEEDAKQKKKDIQREADFYGAMDGASKFVQGDVRVGILITLINIIGGFIIGMTQQGLSASSSAQIFLRFTVGDGLVSQIPSLLVSVATGVIVTRSVSDGSFGDELAKELTLNYKPLFISAGFLFALSFLPGFPMVILWVLAGLFGALGYYIRTHGAIVFDRGAEEAAAQQAEEAASAAEAEDEDVFGLINIDPMELEIGFNLVPLVDPSQGGDLLDRIKLIRKTMALEMGLIVPPIRIRDNMRLSPNEYSVKIKGIEVGHGSLKIDRYLAIPPGPDAEEISGENGIDPVFNSKAKWITEDNRNKAEQAGYSVVDCPTVVATHLTEILRRNGFELLGRQEVKKILDSVRSEYSAVVEEAIQNMKLGEIQKVLQNLLKEGISIRNILTILETASDYSKSTSNIDIITEKVRARLGKQIVQQIKGDSDKLYLLTLSADLENALAESLQESDLGFVSNLDPSTSEDILQGIAQTISKIGYAVTPVIVCSESIRSLVKGLIGQSFPKIQVISYSELAVGEVAAEHLGVIKAQEKDNNENQEDNIA